MMTTKTANISVDIFVGNEEERDSNFPSHINSCPRHQSRRKSNDSTSSLNSSSSSSFSTDAGSSISTTLVDKDGDNPKRRNPNESRRVQATGSKNVGKSRRRHRTRPNRCKKKAHIGNGHFPDSTSYQSPVVEDDYVALDCEMVGVGADGQRSMVARVTVVDWRGRTLMDEFIKPTEPVTDYRTFVSGITSDDLSRDAIVTLEKCREMVEGLISNKTLIGHALKNDLRSLGISHPWHSTRDTGKYEPFMKEVPSLNVLSHAGSTRTLYPRKLSELAKLWLERDIQQPGQPHSPYEDAVAAMDLYKLVRNKWERVMEYKIEKTRTIMAAQQVQQKQPHMDTEFPPLPTLKAAE